MKAPRPIELSLEELEAVVRRAELGKLRDGDAQIIKAMMETIKFLSAALQEKNISLKRLRNIIFGPKTEKTEAVVKKPQGVESNIESTDVGAAARGTELQKNKRKGHGRNGAEAYRGAERVQIPHPTLKPKDPCPVCPKGKLYDTKRPLVVVRVVGKPPVQAKVFELQKLRCNLCGEVFPADLPEDCADEKYDASAGSIIALLKYGGGFPFYRLEKLQDNFEVPLPASTQWEIVEGKADRIYPVYNELIHQAAQGDVVHNDDTVMKILELIKENKKAEQQVPGRGNRTGMFTTGILSIQGKRKIALFHTGRKHAGENMSDVLRQRDTDRGPPIQMCDALSRNVPEELKVILANCLAHARRKFVDVAEVFPEECRIVLEILKEVYEHDEEAKKQYLSAQQRLELHQSKSGPLMEELKNWLEKQVQWKKVEPNSSMGQAFSYMLNHWEPLTLFLRLPGAPLDNNICERVLKRAILNRKNSLFYKTSHGAYVGDLFMSIIYTCDLAGINAFEYLNALEENSAELFKHPELWLPWNYRQQLIGQADQPA